MGAWDIVSDCVPGPGNGRPTSHSLCVRLPVAKRSVASGMTGVFPLHDYYKSTTERPRNAKSLPQLLRSAPI